MQVPARRVSKKFSPKDTDLIKLSKAIIPTEIKFQLNAKMKEYEDNINKRREKLRTLLGKEERDFIKETVDVAIKSQDDLFLERKIQVQKLNAKREEERLAFVKEKKIQQIIEGCHDFREIAHKYYKEETKDAQLQQIRDNQAKKEAERELDKFWHEMLLEEIATQKRRLEQDCLNSKLHLKEIRETLDIQVQQNKIKKQLELREKCEEAIKIESLKEEMRKEEIAKLEAKRRQRDQYYQDIVKQLKERELKMAKEMEIDRQYAKIVNELVEKELEKEKMIENMKASIRQEMKQYRDYIARLNEERKEEDRRLDELLQEQTKQIQEKEDEAKRRFKIAQESLKYNVLQTCQDQIKYKRQQAEEQLKIKEAENQMLQIAMKQNDRLRADYNRQLLLAQKKYSDDLRQQIEYSKLLKEREKEEIERRILEGQMQEENYRKELEAYLRSDRKAVLEHPFHRVLRKQKFC